MARLSLVEYMDYLGSTNSSRCVYEGEEVLNAGHIILYGKLSSSTSENINICALCLQTSALNSDPHQIKGQLITSQTGSIKIKAMSCSCKAGNSGRCKHISAVLIKCTRENLHDFEIISQTDLKCVWATQKNVTREKYTAVPIKDMPCFKNKTQPCLLNIDEEKIYNFFIEKLPESAISKHRTGRRIFTDTILNKNGVLNVDNYYKAILDNSCQSILMLEISSVQINNTNDCCKEWYSNLFNVLPEMIIATTQQSEEWHVQRKYRVTGSRIYELYTYSRNQWENKSTKYFYSKSFSNKYTKHGILYEGDAKEMFIEQTSFHVVECGMVVSHSNPWLGYSPDGVIFEGKKPIALLEIKCLYKDFFELKVAGNNGEDRDIGVQRASQTITEVIEETHFLQKRGRQYFLREKHKYYGQIQLGMTLLNLPKCYFMLYASFDKTSEIIEIDFNYNFSKQMLSAVKINFFENMFHTICTSNKI